MNIASLFAVGFGGFIGALLRFYVGILCIKLLPTHFYFSTLIVNLISSFFIGFFLSFLISSNLKNFIVVGILGGLSTFSTFSYENFIYLQNGEFIKLCINIFLNVFLCLAFCCIGNFIAKAFYI
ncbi:CrcB family protein [Campylobacter sp. RM12327]|uniref:fluoride efflux transporter FluC n=1 Tax=Campylobacter sputorum TaxID=206 RepID=UPI000B79AB7A|nr:MULTISPECIES: CrcB family protein [Campylobacter]ASM39885.1 putative fluoride ion transporter [Campylobacter sputorum]MBE7357535.1 CrcB family protein [Campylobacter sp. RM11302]MBF6669165.1 CrcB family protein [Campylobacter sp. RM12327]MBF6674360.1 CrcB family protein [Campylobacter sp. RM13538]MBF6675401.1 CrcB family protein [Campylobacter sp. RM12321]